MADVFEDKKNIPALIQEVLDENNVTEEEIAKVVERFKSCPEKTFTTLGVVFTKMRKNLYDHAASINSMPNANLVNKELRVEAPNSLLWVLDQSIAAIRDKDTYRIAAAYLVFRLLSEKLDKLTEYHLSSMLQFVRGYEEDE